MKTEDYILDTDIKVFYVTADSFPEGVAKAHEALHSLQGITENRNFYGISRPEKNGVIVYRAATEELAEGEAEKYKCESLVLKKGNYISLLICNYEAHLEEISKGFKILLQDPRIDREGYCVEMYLDKDVRCMVRLEESK